MRRHIVSGNRTGLVAVVTLLLVFGAAVLQAQNDSTSSGDASHQHQPVFVPSTENIMNLSLSRLGGELVTIWNDSRLGSRYYYPPLLIPDWEKFTEDVGEACPEGAEDVGVNINLLISLSDQHYRREIRQRLWETNEDDEEIQLIPENEVNALPHDNIQILLRVNAALSSRLLYDKRGRSRTPSDDDALSSTFVSYRPDIQVPVSGTCGALTHLRNLAMRGENLLDGRIYFSGIQYQTTSFVAEVNRYLDSARSVDLFGNETLVRRHRFQNTSGVATGTGGDHSAEMLLLSMPVIQHSGEGESSRQRLLSRDYLDHIARTSFAGIAGGCVEATSDGERCGELQNMFVEFLLRHTEAIELTFQKLENGSHELLRDQVTYATLSPEQFRTIAQVAPDIRGSVGASGAGTSGDSEGSAGRQGSPASAPGLSVRTSDNITWDVSGSEPVPTKVDLLILHKQSFRHALDIEWYNRVPIESSFQRYIVPLDYFPQRIADGRILTTGRYEERENLRRSCINGGHIVAVMNPTRQHTRRSTDCTIRFSGGWQAEDGHFLHLREGGAPLRVTRWWASENRSFNTELTPHELDVTRENGANQMIIEVNYRGRANEGHGVFFRRTCGARIRLNMLQQPIRCAPFLVDGFSDRHGRLEPDDPE